MTQPREFPPINSYVEMQYIKYTEMTWPVFKKIASL